MEQPTQEHLSGIKIEAQGENCVVFKFANGSLNVTVKQGSICEEQCDVIVNTTRRCMRPNGGLDEAMHKRMGKLFSDQVLSVSDDLNDEACPEGQSRIFVARSLQNPHVPRYVINTVGPVFRAHENKQAAFLLQSCYRTSLALAELYSLTSIAYPAISCGAHRYPLDQAAKVAIESIRQYAYGVRDVRFVLYDNNVYQAFVRAWCDHAEEINRAAAVPISSIINTDDPSQSSLTKTKSSTGSLISRCSLCQERLSTDDGDSLCSNCKQLTRKEFFEKLLNQLRTAADKSFRELERVCNQLKPILVYYPLSYIPVQKFDQSVHVRDREAEYYLQNHCGRTLRNCIPMAVLGDGNCFYNTFVKLGGVGTTEEEAAITPVELRGRNIIELVLHKIEYANKYERLIGILDPLEDYVRREMVNDGNYVAVWDLLSMPTVLNIQITSVYPRVNGDEDQYYLNLNDVQFDPLITTERQPEHSILVDAAASRRVVKLLFSNCNKPTNFGKRKDHWIPNHYVPILDLR